MNYYFKLMNSISSCFIQNVLNLMHLLYIQELLIKSIIFEAVFQFELIIVMNALLFFKIFITICFALIYHSPLLYNIGILKTITNL